MTKNQKNLRRAKIRRRVRAKISGTAERPRLSVYRSLKHIYLQIIDDNAEVTLVAASTKTAELSDALKGKSYSERAAIVGKYIAEKAVEAGITTVVFDRGGYLYHGKVKAAAEAAREGGLKF
jgi:large subunit ribosomal protein L18